MSANAAPGWYPDPQGMPHTERWWDGNAWTQHTQAAAGAQAPAATAMTAASGAPTSTTDGNARTWAMVAHLSAIAGAFVALAFLGPLVVYLIKKDEHPYIRQQSAEALNFNLSFLLYTVIFGIVFVITLLLIVGVILIPVAIAGAVAWLVFVIIGAIKANNGEAWRYPLTIRFID